jgi:hypothetical protein
MMETNSTWVPRVLLSLLEQQLDDAMHRLESSDRVMLSIDQRSGGIQSDLITAAETGYSAMESTIRMVASDYLRDNTELASDARQRILETAAGYFSLPDISLNRPSQWNRQIGMFVASGLAVVYWLPLLALMKDLNLAPLNVAISVIGTALVGASIHEVIWRIVAANLARDYLALLPHYLDVRYRRYAKDAIAKYIGMIEANVAEKTSAIEAKER